MSCAVSGTCARGCRKNERHVTAESVREHKYTMNVCPPSRQVHNSRIIAGSISLWSDGCNECGAYAAALFDTFGSERNGAEIYGCRTP